jgi:hypothetical protein
MTQEALKLALEEYLCREMPAGTVIGDPKFWVPRIATAIKEALAQPAQEPVAWPCLIAEADFEQNTITLEMQCSNYKVGAGQHWLYTTPPAAQPAQEPVCPACKAGVLYECVACSSNNYPPQGVQEPVACIHKGHLYMSHEFMSGIPDGATLLYTAPPQRPWVDLTDDEEIADYLGDEYHTMTESDLRFFRLGEAAAKEKNNG